MSAIDQINQGGTTYEIVPEIAELFSIEKTYRAGDHVIYEAGWYTFKIDKYAGTWDATKVDGPFKVTDQISSIKSDLWHSVDFTSRLVGSGRIITNGAVGSVVDLTPVTDNLYKYVIVPVHKGDTLTLTVAGGNSGRAYAFVDNEYKIISQCEADATRTNATINVEWDGYCIVNTNLTNSLVVLNTISNITDVTLSQSGIPADAKVVGDKIKTLSTLEAEYDQLGAVPSKNLFNYDTIVKGKIILANGTISDNDSYFYSGYIDVRNVDSITIYRVFSASSYSGVKDIVCYNEQKGFMHRRSDIVANNADGSHTYAVEKNVAYIRLNIAYSTKRDELMVNKGSMLMPYAPYGFVSKNLFNYKTATYNKVIKSDGTIGDSNYMFSDYIYVGEGNSITVMPTTGGPAPKGAVSIALYDANKNFLSRVPDLDLRTLNPDGSYTQVAGSGVEYMRINFNVTSDEETIMVNLGDKMLPFAPYGLYGVEDRLSALSANNNILSNEPPIVFDQDYSLHDVSNVINNMDWSDGIMQSDILEQTYALFDELVANYDYVSKEDVGARLGMAYPAYANGTVEGVPQYKTYMYKFVFSDPEIGTDKHKKNALIVSGTHGNEIAAPVNTYLFAKQLCEATDPNYFKLRAAFDFYIIPCLNGYGMYKITRGNGNKVNINRNYPIRKWEEKGADTKDSAWANEYTGASAGSEFETQIVMRITGELKPVLCIDHHNYGSNLEKQFYVEVETDELLPVIYQELADCMIAFKKGLPQYFGSAFQMLTYGEAPKETASDRNGTTSRYWYENGYVNASTLEISQSINYVNGSFDGGQDLFGADTFSVGEYTLREHILKCGQWALNH